MLTRIEYHQNIHLRAKFHEVAGFRISGNVRKVTFRIHLNFAEEVYIGTEVAQAETPIGQFRQEVVAGVAEEIVMMLLETLVAETVLDAGSSAVPADQVMPAAGVCR